MQSRAGSEAADGAGGCERGNAQLATRQAHEGGARVRIGCHYCYCCKEATALRCQQPKWVWNVEAWNR